MELNVNLRPTGESRQSKQYFNTFVRLPRVAVQCLWNEIFSLSDVQRQQTHHDSSSRWIAIRENQHVPAIADDIEFLPLKLTFKVIPNENTTDEESTVTVYASYNGGICEGENVIDLPESLLPNQQNGAIGDTNLMAAFRDQVYVEPLPKIDTAASVRMVPLTCSDWEFLEIFAQDLECGQLLNQISVVYPNQIVTLRLGSDLVHLKVLEQDFLAKEDYEDESDDDLSQDSCDADIDLPEDAKMSIVHPCLRLVADTQVVVTPKPRASQKKKERFASSGPFRVVPTASDFSSHMKKVLTLHNRPSSSLGADTSDSLIPCPPQCTVWIHPDTLSNEVDGWCNDGSMEPITVLLKKAENPFLVKRIRPSQSPDDEDEEKFVVASLCAYDGIPLGSVVLHPHLRHQIKITPLLNHVEVQILTQLEVQEKTNAVLRGIKEKTLGVQLESFYPDDNDGTSEKSQEIEFGPWRMPEEYSSSPTFFASSNQEERNELSGQFLSHGSIVAFPIHNELTLCRVILKLGQAEEEECLKPSPMNYLIPSNELENLVVTKTNLPSTSENYLEQDYTLNILPSTLPSSVSEFKKVEETILQEVNLNEESSTNVILTGSKGCGKTHAALTTAALLRMRQSYASVYLDCRLLQTSQMSMDEILTELSSVFHEAICSQPCLLILDDLDEIVPNTAQESPGGGSSAHEQQSSNHVLVNQVKLLTDHICSLIRGLISSTRATECLLLCTRHHNNSLNKALRCSNFFTSSIPIPALQSAQRLAVFQSMLATQHDLDINPNLRITESFKINFNKRTEGYRPHDLRALSSRVTSALQHHEILSSSESSRSSVQIEDLIDEALSSYIPLYQQSLNLQTSKSALSWSDIGGLFAAKKALSDAVLSPVKYRLIYEQSPISLPRGILLFGPSGCGKSCIVPALAEECNFHLVTCRGPELLDKYIGASEAKVRDLFEKAYAASPAILFLDEFEALAPRRGTDNTGVTDRVVNQLLTFLDGVEDPGTGKQQVYIVAASSRPDKVDPALLRPGRLENHIFVGFPENLEERKDLFQTISQSRSIEEETRRQISDGSFITQMRQEQLSVFESLSAADMKAVFDTAHLIAVHEILESNTSTPSEVISPTLPEKVILSTNHLIEALSSTKASLSEDDRRAFAKSYFPFLPNSLKDEKHMRGLGLQPTDLSAISTSTDKLKTALK